MSLKTILQTPQLNTRKWQMNPSHQSTPIPNETLDSTGINPMMIEARNKMTEIMCTLLDLHDLAPTTMAMAQGLSQAQRTEIEASLDDLNAVVPMLERYRIAAQCELQRRGSGELLI